MVECSLYKISCLFLHLVFTWVFLMSNKMKNKKIPHCRNNSIITYQNRIERGKIDTTNTQIHDCLLSRLGTGTSTNKWKKRNDLSNLSNIKPVAQCMKCLDFVLIFHSNQHYRMWFVSVFMMFWLIECCLTTNEQFFSYVMARENYISKRWW